MVFHWGGKLSALYSTSTPAWCTPRGVVASVDKHCFRVCAVSRMSHTCVTIDVFPCSCERCWWHRITSVEASLRILWYILLVVCVSCYLLGFSCGAFGPSSAYNLVARGPAACLAPVAVLLGPASGATFYFATVGGGIFGVTSLRILCEH